MTHPSVELWTLEWCVSASVTLMATWLCIGIPYYCSAGHRSLLSPAGHTLAHRSALLDIPLLARHRPLLSPAGHTIAHAALLDILLLTQALAQPCWTYHCSALLDILLLTQALAQPCWLDTNAQLALLDTGPVTPIDPVLPPATGVKILDRLF